MAAPAQLLRIRGVAKRFNSVVALRSADLEVRAGEIHALMGANGAGKSTLVKITPTVWENSGAGLELLKKAYDPKLDPFYSVAIDVAPYTSYNMAQILACKGP